MIRIVLILGIGLLISGSCKKDEPCDLLVNGVYQFPEVPANHGMTSQELQDFLDLPADIAECISTPGLVETCMNFPNLMLITAGINPQSGYTLLVKPRFRGVRELEERPDRATALLAKYNVIDPLGYNPSWEPRDIGAHQLYVSNFEVVFSQYLNLAPLTMQEKIELIERAIAVFEMKLSIPDSSIWGLSSTATLLGRLMLHNNYASMVELNHDNPIVAEMIAFYWPTSYDATYLVYKLAKEYLHHLKS